MLRFCKNAKRTGEGSPCTLLQSLRFGYASAPPFNKGGAKCGCATAQGRLYGVWPTRDSNATFSTWLHTRSYVRSQGCSQLNDSPLKKIGLNTYRLQNSKGVYLLTITFLWQHNVHLIKLEFVAPSFMQRILRTMK